LYGIGSQLAKQIVKYRKTQGYFHGPEDLANVAGISTELAITLSPHIDWSFPAKRVQVKEREWVVTILCLLMASTLLWSLIDTFQVFKPLDTFTTLREHGEYELAVQSAWYSSSVLLTTAIGLLTTLMVAVKAWTRSKAVSQFCKRIEIPLIASYLVAGASRVISFVVMSEIYMSEGWSGLHRDYFALVVVIGSFVICSLLLVPRVLLFVNPKVAQSVLLARSYDIGIVALGLTHGLLFWVYRNDLPWWVLGIHSIFSIMLVWLGWETLRGRSTYLSLLADPPESNSIGTVNVWLRWINIRLPDPERQKALRHALNEAYPPSKVRAIGGLILIVAGGWVLLTILSAIIEWFVQGWLNRFY
jgi:hypothetical protein